MLAELDNAERQLAAAEHRHGMLAYVVTDAQVEADDLRAQLAEAEEHCKRQVWMTVR